MHAERERQFAAVVQVVLDDMPEHPLTRIPGFITAVVFPWIPVLKLFRKIGGRPATQGILDHRTSGLQSSGQFGGAALRVAAPLPLPPRRPGRAAPPPHKNGPTQRPSHSL